MKPVLSRKFDESKHIAGNGYPYWRARELMPRLGYEEWRKFRGAIERAIAACESSGFDASHQFVGSANMMKVGKGGNRKVEDLFLTRYACYLVAMNGDPRKPEIAEAQTYFAVQTKRQEHADQLVEARKRLDQRERIREANVHLADAAKAAGVHKYGLFQDAGYRGLYGMGVRQIKKRKGISSKDQILDRAGRVELAANEFRITQTEEAIHNKQIRGEGAAIDEHHRAGREVRQAMQRIGKTMPEDLPAEPHIRDIKKQLKASKKKLLPEINPDSN